MAYLTSNMCMAPTLQEFLTAFTASNFIIVVHSSILCWICVIFHSACSMTLWTLSI